MYSILRTVGTVYRGIPLCVVNVVVKGQSQSKRCMGTQMPVLLIQDLNKKGSQGEIVKVELMYVKLMVLRNIS